MSDTKDPDTKPRDYRASLVLPATDIPMQAGLPEAEPRLLARWDAMDLYGCIGQWDKPYTTMDFRAEATIARELFKFVDNDLLYRGFRPVMWSPVEKTALAEAEVEYQEKSSPTIYVKFPVVKGDIPGASIVI